RIKLVGLCAKAPVGGREEEKIGVGSVSLAEFKDGLARGDVVASMAVEEDQAFEAVPEKIFHEPAEQIEIGSRGAGECSGKIEVVIGISEPEKRGEEHAIG